MAHKGGGVSQRINLDGLFLRFLSLGRLRKFISFQIVMSPPTFTCAPLAFVGWTGDRYPASRPKFSFFAWFSFLFTIRFGVREVCWVFDWEGRPHAVLRTHQVECFVGTA